METITRIRLNKNRGWRGLAELVCLNEELKIVHKMLFSFSEPVWKDMLKGYMVMQDDDNYIVLQFDNTDALPSPTQQRSVLIKNFNATIIDIKTYAKNEPLNVMSDDYDKIYNFLHNKNNHTTSDWNCIRNTCNSNYLKKGGI